MSLTALPVPAAVAMAKLTPVAEEEQDAEEAVVVGQGERGPRQWPPRPSLQQQQQQPPHCGRERRSRSAVGALCQVHSFRLASILLLRIYLVVVLKILLTTTPLTFDLQ